MGRPLSLRSALAAVLLLPLAACLGGEGGAGSGAKPAEAQRSATFYRGKVVVAGPQGYCIDPKSVQRKTASGFALMASCGHLSAAPGGYVPAAVITASVLPYDADAQAPTAARLAAPWVDVGVGQQIDAGEIALIQVERGGDSLLPAGDPRHWRGAMLVNGHLIGLALYGDTGANVAGDQGRTLLMETAQAIRSASPRLAPAGSVSTKDVAPAPTDRLAEPERAALPSVPQD
ncbi:hypothetical protein [Roseovarius dicentrarchi]|uniref:hypothetical protein n=1 Tax=Roseovarius dicentrarchi TaxID=2250573 RepID=UPI000DE9D2F7|nr:hypothetical protein [Roseovarius dicentrarchi]